METSPRLVAIDGPLKGHIIDVAPEGLSIGRGTGNRLVLSDPAVSRLHCILEVRPTGFFIRDLDSHNGTFINGLPIGDRLLQEGDEIKVGESVLRFLLAVSAANTPFQSVHFADGPVDSNTVLLLRGNESVYLRPEDAIAAEAPVNPAVRGYQTLLRIAAALHVSEGADALADALLDVLLQAIPAASGAVLLVRPGDADPTLARTLDRASGPDAPVDVNRTIIDRVLREGIAILSAGSIVAVPLATREHMLGVIYLSAELPRVALSEDHLQLAAAVGLMAGPVFEDAAEFDRLAQQNRLYEEEIRLQHDMVGEGPRMREVYRTISRVAPSDSTVLILGETGTGKELVARAVHRNSPRARRPFVAINCAALTESLLETELFGHERGAFTGAVAQKKGKLEVADQGTVFLDEIGELPLSLQTKLLRVLQEREFERVGGTRPIHIDVRLVAATNRDLRTQVDQGSFRQDLYYRLNVVAVRLPPLRERREDIPLLVSYFLAKCRERSPRRIAGISDAARRCLLDYDWPGNVRELQNAIESAVVLGVGEMIAPEDLPEVVTEAAAIEGEADGYRGSLKQKKSEMILAAIEQSGGNITEAARLLKLHPNYLHRLIRNFGLRGRLRNAI